jgi:peptidoglycan hydrolase-like protein with peptidoglycan-binding domain
MKFNRSSVLLTSIALFAPWIAHADEQIRSMQEELRRRNIYFGEIDGRSTAELTEATRKYQRRKGIAATGDADTNTLRSLGLLPRFMDEPPPRDLNWPEEPVLKSDATADVANIAQEVSRETGVVATNLTGGKPVDKPNARVSTSRRGGSRASSSLGRESSPPPIAQKNDARLEPAELNRYIREYLKAVEGNDLRREIRFYGDRVQYYHNGWVDRRVVEESLRRYYQRWPRRSYKLLSALNYSFNPRKGEIVCTFRISFSLKSRGKTVRGQTDNQFLITAATADPRIVSIQERRVRQ